MFHAQGWSIPAELSSIHTYLESLPKVSEWQSTGYEQKCIMEHYRPLLVQ